MRRRTWGVVRMFDVFFSHQVSLPSMISEHDCDTELPRNIYDGEFGPESKVLPPSRPNSEPTPVSYMIYKVKYCLLLGAILQATGRIEDPVQYDEILRFDAKLRDIKAELPPHLRLQPLEGSHDRLTLVMARFSIDILHRRIMCLLHRKYIPRARHNPRYAHSRRSAIESSVETLRHLATLHRASQPNGRLHSAKWFFTSVATKDFLLPAMLIALDLHFDNAAPAAGERRDSQSLHFWTREQREEMISLLEMTRDVWKGLADTSIEAVKASNTIEVMLTKIKSPADSKRSYEESAMAGSAGLPAPSAAMTPDMLSNGPMRNPAGGFSTVQSPVGAMYGTFDPTLDRAGASLSASTGVSPSTGQGGIAGPEFSNAMLGFDAALPPLTMFDNMASSNLDLPGNFDWVWILSYPSSHTGHLLICRIQDSFENYTQTAHWGAESLQFFSGNPDQSQQQALPDGSTTFPYNLDLTGLN